MSEIPLELMAPLSPSSWKRYVPVAVRGLPIISVAGPRVLGIIQLRDLGLPKIWDPRIIVRPGSWTESE